MALAKKKIKNKIKNKKVHQTECRPCAMVLAKKKIKKNKKKHRTECRPCANGTG